jgi:histone-lysine N-methyltransferase SETMAR
MKTKDICFFDIKGIFHFNFLPQRQTVNQTYYMGILKGLCEALPRQTSELWPSDWILHHDNSPAHKAFSVKQFLAQKSSTEMKHPSHSPELAPNDFWLFPKMKSVLKGRRFRDVDDIQIM